MGTDNPPPSRGTRRGRPTLVVLVGTIALLSIGVLLAGRWWTHPTVFGSSVNGFETQQTRGHYTSLNVSFTDPPVENDPETVTVDRAVPHVIQNTAAAVISVHVCTGGPFITVLGPLEKACSKVEPVLAGTRLNTDATANQRVVVTVTPTRPGTVRIIGLDLTYHRDWVHSGQRGTERPGYELILHAR